MKLTLGKTGFVTLLIIGIAMGQTDTKCPKGKKYSCVGAGGVCIFGCYNDADIEWSAAANCADVGTGTMTLGYGPKWNYQAHKCEDHWYHCEKIGQCVDISKDEYLQRQKTSPGYVSLAAAQITGSPTKGAVTIKPVCHDGHGKLMADCGRCLTDAPCTIDVPAKPKPAKPPAKKVAPKCSGCGTVTDLGPCTADWCRHAEPLEFNPKGMMDSFSEITSIKMGLTLMSKDGVLLMTCEPSADNKKWDQVGHCTIADGHTFDEVIHATLEQIRLTQDEWTEDRHQYRCPKVK